jgi:hypothetical protein
MMPSLMSRRYYELALALYSANSENGDGTSLMIPRILSVAGPLFIYATLAVLGWGLWRERKKLEWLALAPALAGLIASFAVLAPIHRLFFDEDIYINIASNLTRAPVAQITLLGGPDDVEVSSYYKQPPGWPVVLSLVFLLAGRTETVAFVFARILFAIAIAAVYQLSREALQTKKQALAAAILFGAVPVCFWFSVSAGTDIPAALFTTLGMWGCLAGNGPLAAAAFALAAQTRMELIVLVPIVWLSGKIPVKWKAIASALLVAELAHIGWLMTVTPVLAAAEKAPVWMSLGFIPGNLVANVRYLFNPMQFPAGVMAAAVVAGLKRSGKGGRGLLALQIGAMFGVYILFYAGSFDMNPRYSIQFLAPLAVVAASALTRPVFIAGAILSLVLPYTVRLEFTGYLQALAADHRLSVQFASQIGASDLVLSTEPQIFLNQGREAVDAAFAFERRDKLDEVMRRPGKIWYHAGATTNLVETREWRADQWVKSNLELHLIDAHEVAGTKIAFYEVLLKLVDRKAGLRSPFEGDRNRSERR